MLRHKLKVAFCFVVTLNIFPFSVSSGPEFDFGCFVFFCQIAHFIFALLRCLVAWNMFSASSLVQLLCNRFSFWRIICFIAKLLFVLTEQLDEDFFFSLLRSVSDTTGSPSSLFEHNMASKYKGLNGIFYKISMEVIFASMENYPITQIILRTRVLSEVLIYLAYNHAWWQRTLQLGNSSSSHAVGFSYNWSNEQGPRQAFASWDRRSLSTWSGMLVWSRKRRQDREKWILQIL